MRATCHFLIDFEDTSPGGNHTWDNELGQEAVAGVVIDPGGRFPTACCQMPSKYF